jgi:hypothetical protein
MLTKITKLMGPEDDKGGGGDDLEAKIAAAVAAALPKALNGAITSHLNRVTAKFEERFKAIEKPAGGGEGDDGEEAPGAPGAGRQGTPGALAPEVQKQLDQMQKRLDKAERETKAEREKLQAEEAKRLSNEDRAALSKVLGEKKVSPEMLPAAIALLYGEEKRVVRGSDGKHRWRDDDDTEIDMSEGADKFLKTGAGQRFLPPTGSLGGGGSPPGSKPRPGGDGDAYAGESIMGLVARVAQGTGPAGQG